MTPPAPGSIGRGVAVGAGWMILFRLADRGIGLGSLAILARVLLPEDFGVVALAVSFIALVDMFAQFGVDVALIQNAHPERRHYDSAWTINLCTAVVISVLIVSLAGQAAAFFAEPRVQAIAWWLALANMIRALENVGVVDFRKRLEFHKEFRYLFASRVLSTLATVLLALHWREYWALVAGSLAQAVIRVALSYVVSAYRPRLSLAGLDDLFHFSKWMLVQNLVHGLNERAASLVLGRLSGADAVALYGIAYDVSNLATTELAAPIRRALLPGFAKMAGDVRALREGFIRTVAVIVLIGLPVPVGIALTAPRIVDVLLGPRWSGATALIQVLALHGVLRTLGTSSSVVYLALGKPRITAVLAVLRLLVMLPLLVVMALHYGVIGAAWAMVITSAVLWILDVAIVLRVLAFHATKFFGVVWRPVAGSLVMSLAVYVLQQTLPAPPTLLAAILQLASIATTGALTYASVCTMLWRACLRPQGAESTIFGMLRGVKAAR